ncbi:MAG: pentapeptide repeat-containing protein [Geminicoccales bacterium]
MTGRPTIVRPPGFEVDIHGAFVRRTDLSHANLERANLSYADATNANLRGANFKDANLQGTILRGADLREAKNLTREQLSAAIIDETTLLPDYLKREELLSAQR